MTSLAYHGYSTLQYTGTTLVPPWPHSATTIWPALVWRFHSSPLISQQVTPSSHLCHTLPCHTCITLMSQHITYMCITRSHHITPVTLWPLSQVTPTSHVVTPHHINQVIQVTPHHVCVTLWLLSQVMPWVMPTPRLRHTLATLPGRASALLLTAARQQWPSAVHAHHRPPEQPP